MIGINTPSTAQEEDHKAVIEQLTKVIKSDAPDKEDQVKDLFKEYKKEPDVIVAVGRAYLDIKDTENAQKYADMAIKRDKNYGDAYVLAGDIQVINDNGGAASALFEQAIYFDPKNPNGYRRYAQVNSKANPSAAVAKLEEMKKQIPDYPIALISAEIFSKSGDLDKAIQYYTQVDKSQMEDYQLVDFALSYFLKGVWRFRSSETTSSRAIPPSTVYRSSTLQTSSVTTRHCSMPTNCSMSRMRQK